MPTIPLLQVMPGMVLETAVGSPDGLAQLPAATILTAAHVQLLTEWRALEITVLPVAAQTTAQASEDTEAVYGRFRLLPLQEPVPATLYALAQRKHAGIATCPLTRAGTLRRSLPPDLPTAEAILANDPTLVSLPEIFMRIREVVSDPSSTIEEATAVIGKDPSLTAKLLKLVNSAFYARTLRMSGGLPPGRVDTLSRAVMLLGLNQLATLAMGVSVLPLFKDIPPEIVNMTLFWRHSVGVGIVTKLLAVRLRDPSPERFFVAGLLHDIGRLVLFKQAPALAAAALAEAEQTGRRLLDVERELLGFDHATLGGMLLRKWRFPESLEQSVWRHHDPLSGEIPLEPALVNIADMIAAAVLPGCSGERLVPRYCADVWQSVGLDATELEALVETAEAHFEVISAMFS